MTQPDSTALAQALLAAPQWALSGLASPWQGLREDAAREVAETILGVSGASEALPDPRQITLPL
jgi:hypothetical protein